MKKSILYLFYIAFLISCFDVNKEPNTLLQDDQNLSARIDSVVNKFLKEGKTHGISTAILENGDTLYNKGFGYVDSLKSVPVTNEHIFKLASISKLIGATMTMRLVEEGFLSLDDLLIDLLPDYPNKVHASKIKLKHLLSHTSGLMDYAMVIDSMYIKTGINPTSEDYYRFFASHELMFEPGMRYAYSNTGFKLMEMIIERSTGKLFSEEIDRIINDPTDLHIKLISERVAHPSMSTYFALENTILEPTKHWAWISGDGGLTATSLELAHFPFYWFDETIITKESFDQMTSPYILDNGIRTGYGMGVRTGVFEGESVIGHTGGNRSGYAMMLFFPERQLSIVVFVNTDNTPIDAIFLMGPVALAVLNKEVPNLRELEVGNVDLQKYSGAYGHHSYTQQLETPYILTTYEGDARLYRKQKHSSNKGQMLLYLGNDEFAYEEYPMDRIKFELDENGVPAAYKIYWNGLFQRMGFRLDRN